MYIIYNRKLKEDYIKKMYKTKKKVRKEFFASSIKRRIIKPFLWFKPTRIILKNIVPYTYGHIRKKTDYFSNNRVAIYTAIYGSYDKIFEPKCLPDNCDYYIFTDDDKIARNTAWKKKSVTLKNFEKYTNSEKNRFLKMHPHLLFPDYDYSIYIDGNIEVMTDFTEFIQDFNKFGIKLHKHFSRHCVYKEIDECILQNKIPIEQLEQYRKKLLNENFPRNIGLLEAPIICRQHNNKNCIKLMNLWWNEYSHNIRRDQIALAYILYKEQIDIEKLGELGEDIHADYSFIQHSHKEVKKRGQK